MDKPNLRVEYFAGSLLFASRQSRLQPRERAGEISPLIIPHPLNSPCRTRFHEPPPQENERKKEFSLSPIRYRQTDFATISFFFKLSGVSSVAGARIKVRLSFVFRIYFLPLQKHYIDIEYISAE